MPNFRIPEEGVASLAAYLHTLRGQENEASRQWEFMISFMINTRAVDRGEMVWKRLACWSCHGEKGRGGIESPNAALGHEEVPDLKGVRDAYSMEEFFGKITAGTTVPAVDADAIPAPYVCPAYPADAVDEQELVDLYAFVSSFAPKKRKWKFK